MPVGNGSPGRSRRWVAGVGAATLRDRRPRPAVGVVATLAGVAVATVTVYILRGIAPVVSLSVVYLPVVLLVSTYWGLVLGLLTSVLSAAAFNFFHIPPTGRFTIFDSHNWVALGTFMIVALVTSTVAELARSRATEAERRRAEADLASALARDLLSGLDTNRALATAARRVAEALGLSSAAVELGSVHAGPGRVALPLRGVDGRQVGALLVPSGLPADTEHRLHAHVVPTLEALVAMAQRRDAMQQEEVETAALRRSDELKTALLRAVSHDLRTPLTAVVAAGHALGAGSLTDQERAELSAAVVDEGTRLAGLVDKLLALSRLQAGTATPRSDWVSIDDLIAAAAESLRGDAVGLHVIVDREVPEIRADAAQLERAFANLLENAHRYGGGQPAVVHARRAGDRVVISIVDRGPGIDAAEQKRIFEPFFRGRAASERGWTGSGLGLAIVKGFIEANGGTISVESVPGQSTSFLVSLPIDPRVAPPVPAGAAQEL